MQRLRAALYLPALFTAIAAEQVVPARRASACPGNRPQRPVPGRVAMTIIDALEVVDIDQRDGGASGTGQSLRGGLHEMATRRRAGRIAWPQSAAAGTGFPRGP